MKDKIFEKQEIRRKIKNLRLLMPERDRLSAAEEVFDRLEKTAAFMLAENIMMYHSLPDELSTHSFLSKWKDRKRFFLPRVNGVNLEVLPYEESRLELGSFHIEGTWVDIGSPDDYRLANELASRKL